MSCCKTNDNCIHGADKEHADEKFCVINNNINCCCCCSKGGSSGGTPSPGTSHGECCVPLSEDLELFVRKDGSDDNDGFTDTAEGAFLTIGAALKSLHRFCAKGYNVRITIHEGTYEEGVRIGPEYSGVRFNSLTLTAYEDEEVVVVNEGHGIVISGVVGVKVNKIILDVRGALVSNYGLNISVNAQATFTDCSVRSNGSCLYAIHSHTSNLTLNGTTKINVGQCYSAICAGRDSGIHLDGIIHSENTTASIAFLYVNNGNALIVNNCTGIATGKRYHVNLNGVLQANGKTIPGTINGTTANGGVFV